MKKRLYLVCYDITDPKRLGKVARYVNKYGYRVQYSVFAAELSAAGLHALLVGLKNIINSKTDDVRVYPLPRQGEVALMGRQIFPDDIMLVRDGHNLFRLGEKTHSETKSARLPKDDKSVQ